MYANTLINEKHDMAKRRTKPAPKTAPDFLTSRQYIRDSTVKKRKKKLYNIFKKNKILFIFIFNQISKSQNTPPPTYSVKTYFNKKKKCIQLEFKMHFFLS